MMTITDLAVLLPGVTSLWVFPLWVFPFLFMLLLVLLVVPFAAYAAQKWAYRCYKELRTLNRQITVMRAEAEARRDT